jgi:hypothetical protein
MPTSSTPGLLKPQAFDRQAKYRFRYNRRALLIEHLGRQPSPLERLIMERAIETEWKLIQSDALAADPALSREEVREQLRIGLALERELRSGLQALGIRPKAPVTQTRSAPWQALHDEDAA